MGPGAMLFLLTEGWTLALSPFFTLLKAITQTAKLPKGGPSPSFFCKESDLGYVRTE